MVKFLTAYLRVSLVVAGSVGGLWVYSWGLDNYPGWTNIGSLLVGIAIMALGISWRPE